MTDKIEPGKFVSLTYVFNDEEGKVVEQNDIPVGYVYGGETELLGGMDKILLGKTAGDELSQLIPPAKGYGEYDPALIYTEALEEVPAEYRKIGAEVQMQNELGHVKTFIVSKIENEKLIMDGNHPLAGKTLTLKVRISEVRDATEKDMQDSGQYIDKKNLN